MIITEDTSLNEPSTIVVLLVDDQEIIAEGIRQMLADEVDIDFHYCADPTDAIATAERINATVILQDLVMPDVDGLTLVRFYKVNERTKDIPIIVLSSKEDPVIKGEAFSNGATDYLVKLPDKIELIARVRAHAKGYLTQIQRDEAFNALREMQQQLEERNAELKRLSAIDGLTGIPNRRSFDDYADKELRRAIRGKTAYSIILMDIDFFKFYNDNYGHTEGDECLKRVASALAKAAHRPADMVARYGGEEFVVVLPDTDKEGAMIVAEHLREAVAGENIKHEYSKAAEHVSVSIGVCSVFPTQQSKVAEILEAADKALYESKESGRNRSSLNTLAA